MNEHSATSAAIPLVPQAAHQRTILLVDDEENILSSLKRLLRRDGYRILTAGGGAEGLEVLAANAVDVIISDQRMPNMTGVEFLHRVKSVYPQTVRIVLSGYTEFQSITDAINEGAIYKFLTKPWDDEQLRAHIQEAFRHKELADENRHLSEQLTLANQQLRGLLEENQRQRRHDETVLAVMQEILQVIPLPLIGVDDLGMIVCINEKADSLLGSDKPLIGTFAKEGLPAALLAGFVENRELLHWQQDGQNWQARYCSIGVGAGRGGRLLILSPEGDN